jgi:hypothetical protein
MQLVAYDGKKILRRIFTTGITATVDNQVLKIRVRPGFFLQRLFYTAKQIFRTFDGFPAFSTNEVMVVSFFRVVVDKTIAGLAFIYTIQIFQYFEGTIDGRFIDSGQAFLNVADDFLSRQMGMCIMNNVDDKTPLRGQFEAFFS